MLGMIPEEIRDQLSEDLKLVALQRFSIVICNHVAGWAVLYHAFILVDEICYIQQFYITVPGSFFQNLLLHFVQVLLCLSYHELF